MPAETINFDACSTETSKYIKSFLGKMSKNPLVGFGVVGTKTFTISSLILSLIRSWFSLVANPTTHIPFLGYSNKTTLFWLFSVPVKLSVICPIAEYIVLRIGIFFKKLLKISKNFFPIKESDIQPTKVIKNKAIKISTPGISNGR